MRKKDASWLPIHDHFLPGLTLHARYAHLALSTLAAQILAAQMKKKCSLNMQANTDVSLWRKTRQVKSGEKAEITYARAVQHGGEAAEQVKGGQCMTCSFYQFKRCCCGKNNNKNNNNIPIYAYIQNVRRACGAQSATMMACSLTFTSHGNNKGRVGASERRGIEVTCSDLSADKIKAQKPSDSIKASKVRKPGRKAASDLF